MTFNKENAVEAQECLNEIMEAFPKKKAAEFFGHFNHLGLFVSAAIAAAPDEATTEQQQEKK